MPFLAVTVCHIFAHKAALHEKLLKEITVDFPWNADQETMMDKFVQAVVSWPLENDADDFDFVVTTCRMLEGMHVAMCTSFEEAATKHILVTTVTALDTCPTEVAQRIVKWLISATVRAFNTEMKEADTEAAENIFVCARLLLHLLGPSDMEHELAYSQLLGLTPCPILRKSQAV